MKLYPPDRDGPDRPEPDPPLNVVPAWELELRDYPLDRLAYEYRNNHHPEYLAACGREFERRERLEDADSDSGSGLGVLLWIAAVGVAFGCGWIVAKL